MNVSNTWKTIQKNSVQQRACRKWLLWRFKENNFPYSCTRCKQNGLYLAVFGASRMLLPGTWGLAMLASCLSTITSLLSGQAPVRLANSGTLGYANNYYWKQEEFAFVLHIHYIVHWKRGYAPLSNFKALGATYVPRATLDNALAIGWTIVTVALEAFQPNVHLSDDLLASGIILQCTSRPKALIYFLPVVRFHIYHVMCFVQWARAKINRKFRITPYPYDFIQSFIHERQSWLARFVFLPLWFLRLPLEHMSHQATWISREGHRLFLQ